MTLPSMKESEDIEEFITCLEIALRSAVTQRGKWKHSLLTQLTQKVKQPILSMLEDDSVSFEIKEALVARNMTTPAAASEAFFSFSNNQLSDKPMSEIIV